MSDTTTNLAVNGLNILADDSTGGILNPATSLITQLLDVSPPVGMAIVLACLYCFLPAFTSRRRVMIDLIVIAMGATVYPQLADPGKVGFAAHNPVAAEVVTGALLGCGALIISVPVRKLLLKLGLINEPPKEPNATLPPTPPVQPPALPPTV